MKKRTVLEKHIKQIAKKMNIFTAEDVEILTEKPRVEIAMRLEKMVLEGKLKQDGDCFIYAASKINSQKTENSERKTAINARFRIVPFNKTKPEEVYFTNIRQIEGWQHYFLAAPRIKERIKNVIKIINESYCKNLEELRDICRKYSISLRLYRKLKKEILTNGLKNIVLTAKKHEPEEIYYFFKEYYLSPKKYTAEEARELAINRVEQIFGFTKLDVEIRSANALVRQVYKEYSAAKVKKLRSANFSKFDFGTLILR